MENSPFIKGDGGIFILIFTVNYFLYHFHKNPSVLRTSLPAGRQVPLKKGGDKQKPSDFIRREKSLKLGFFRRLSGAKRFSAGEFGFADAFGLGLRFQTFGADFHALAVNHFGLQVDGEFSAGGNIGMATGISRSSSSIADITYSTHSILGTRIS